MLWWSALSGVSTSDQGRLQHCEAMAVTLVMTIALNRSRKSAIGKQTLLI